MQVSNKYFFVSGIFLIIHTALYFCVALKYSSFVFSLMLVIVLLCILFTNNYFVKETFFQYIAFSTLYTFSVPIMVFGGVEVPLLKNRVDHYQALNDVEVNFLMVELYCLSCIAVNLSCFLAACTKSILKSRRRVVRLYGFSLTVNLIFAFLLFLFSLSLLDWNLLKEGYSVGRGFTFLFGSFYILIFLYLTRFSVSHIEKQKNHLWYFLFVTIVVLFLFLGVRQLLIWAAISFFLMLSHLYASGIKERKINLPLVYFFMICVFLVGGILASYRVNRELTFDANIFSLAWSAYLWETGYTYLGGLNAIKEVESGNYLFLSNVVNYFSLLVPSFFGDFRENYFLYTNFIKDNSLATLGTVHLLGEVYVSTGDSFLFFVYFFILFYFVEVSIKTLKNKNYLLYMPIIVFLQLMICFYSVRGGLYSGLKIFTIFALCSYFILYLSSRFYFKKASYNE